MIASGYQIMVRHKADQRRSLEDVWDHVFPPSAPKKKTVTEISGHQFTGTTELLFHIMARAVLPESHGGKSSDVIFIDLNHKHEVGEFEKCLQHVMTRLDTLNPQNIERTSVVRNCLKSVISMSCYCSEQFDLALGELEDLLWDHENVSLIAIDGLDAFYWEDCYGRLQRMSTHYKKLIQRLKLLCREHNICCVYTVDSNYLRSKVKGKVSEIYSLADYQLKLTTKDGEFLFLNDKPFSFDGPSLTTGE